MWEEVFVPTLENDMRKKHGIFRILWIYSCIFLFSYLTGCSVPDKDIFVQNARDTVTVSPEEAAFDLSAVPEYAGEPYVVLNDNIPLFSEEEKADTTSFEIYSRLDGLGRCGVAYANISRELMPTQERGEIRNVKPTGWQNTRYDFVDQESLYNRCHLIGYQLSGENDNERNLITGTRYLNTEGMLPFENKVREYVDETDNHVLYRVTPIFERDNAVASGVEMEAFSVEDAGEGICFHVYVYNVQPGVVIDYETGESQVVAWEKAAADSVNGTEGGQENREENSYILNTNTNKFHKPDCDSVADMKEKNKKEVFSTREEIIEQGYEPCGRCRP